MERISHADANCGAVMVKPISLHNIAMHERCPSCGAWGCWTQGDGKGRTFCCNYCETTFRAPKEKATA